MSTVSLWSAFLAGFLSFVSPCVLPLVPPYLCFLAGITLDDLTETGETAREIRRKVIGSSLAFVLGFSIIFVAYGATASAFGQAFRSLDRSIDLFGLPTTLFSVVAGLVIIGMGLHFLGVFRIGFLNQEMRVQVRNRPAGTLGALIVGGAFALGWTPCIGPMLGSILSLAAREETVAQGAGLLLVYSLGLGIPFMAAALFAGPFLDLMRRFRRHMGTVERVMGGFLVATGILFLGGWMTMLNVWMQQTFPGIANIG